MSPYDFNVVNYSAYLWLVSVVGDDIPTLADTSLSVSSTINLSKNVLVIGGNGTKTNPYKVALK